MSDSDIGFRDVTSLSIEETNKVRLQLGLKPLELDNNDPSDQTESSKVNDFVHVPAKNMGDIKSKEKLEEKIRRHKETRERNEMLASEKLLTDNVMESTEDFLKKVQQKKIELDARKRKEEESEESGDDNDQIDIKSDDIQNYRSNNLCSIPIEHKASRFDLMGPTILTLKDSNVLGDNNEDVLINVNLIDEEKAERNIRNRKMTAYSAYIDSGDEDDTLFSTKSNILAKYDESIDGIKRNRFILDSKGKYDMGQERAEEELRKNIFSGKLHYTFDDELRIASDYISPEEVKNKLRVRKRKAQGIRTTNKKIIAKVEEVEKEQTKLPKKEEGEIAEDEVSKKASTKRERVVKSIGMDLSSDEDDYRPALIMADLNSTVANEELKRKLSLMKKAKPKVWAENASVLDDVKVESTVTDNRKIVLTKTDEFTKSIFNLLQSKRKKDAEKAAQIKEEPIAKPLPAPPKKEKVKEEEEPTQSSGWQPEEKILSLPHQPMKKKRNFREAPVVPKPKKTLKLTDGILGDEVQINQGIFSTLMLVKNKGYLDENKTAPLITNPKNQMLRAQNFQEEKIRYDDMDQKCLRQERRTVPETPFQDKSDFVPDIKLDYHDDFGRPQPPKEAFRLLSHRFHGKTSGKIKSEKRFKKLQEQSKITSCIGDTEMKRVNKMQSKMKSENRFCVPLSGKNSIIPAALKKSAKD